MVHNAYSFDGCAVVQHRANPSTLTLDNGCTVALLTKAPTPEGGGVFEITGARYKRHEIRLAQKNPQSAKFRSLEEVNFGPVDATWETATHAAIFDSSQSVVGYGRLVRSAGFCPAGFVHFSADAISLTFSSF
jgi:hypothetical protein